MITLEREVTATRAEFLHGLRQAFPQGVVETSGGFHVTQQQTALEITLADLPPLILGALSLARLKVGVRGTAGTLAEQHSMLADMDRAMQRGGG